MFQVHNKFKAIIGNTHLQLATNTTYSQQKVLLTMCKSSPKRIVALTDTWSSLLVITSTKPFKNFKNYYIQCTTSYFNIYRKKVASIYSNLKSLVTSRSPLVIKAESTKAK